MVLSCQLEPNLSTTLIWTFLWSQLCPGSKPTTEQRWLLPFPAPSSHSGDQPCVCQGGEQAVMEELSHLAAAGRAVPHSWHPGHSSELGKGETWVTHQPWLLPWLSFITSTGTAGPFYSMQQIIKKKGGRRKKNLLVTTVKKKKGSRGEASMQPQTDKWSLATEGWKLSWERGP